MMCPKRLSLSNLELSNRKEILDKEEICRVKDGNHKRSRSMHPDVDPSVEVKKAKKKEGYRLIDGLGHLR